MSKRNSQIPPALKHGGYSGMTLLPGEDPAAFEKLHNDLIDEYAPCGRHEDDIIETLARLMWRKQNLLTYRLANAASDRYSAISSALNPRVEYQMLGVASPEEYRAAAQAAREQARKELGMAWELIEVGKVATIDHLLDELSVVERLDEVIGRCLKQLLFVRGLKSISSSSSAAPSKPRIKRVA